MPLTNLSDGQASLPSRYEIYREEADEHTTQVDLAETLERNSSKVQHLKTIFL